MGPAALLTLGLSLWGTENSLGGPQAIISSLYNLPLPSAPPREDRHAVH